MAGNIFHSQYVKANDEPKEIILENDALNKVKTLPTTGLSKPRVGCSHPAAAPAQDRSPPDQGRAVRGPLGLY